MWIKLYCTLVKLGNANLYIFKILIWLCTLNHLKNRNAVFLLASEGRESDDPAFLLVLRAASRRVSCRTRCFDRPLKRWTSVWLYMYTKQARMMLFSSVVHVVGSLALVIFSYPFPLYLPLSSPPLLPLPPFSLHHNPCPSSSPTPTASTEETVEVRRYETRK